MKYEDPLPITLQILGAGTALVSLMLVLTEPHLFEPAMASTMLGVIVAAVGWRIGADYE